MEELLPKDLEELVQELEGESHAEEALSPDAEELLTDLDVEGLLTDLQTSSLYLMRQRAADCLGKLVTSSPKIVQALVEAREHDDHHQVRMAAAESLRAPVHQAILRQHPGLKEEAKRDLEQIPDSEPVTRPARFQVETQDGALCISWEPEAEQRKGATKNTGLVLLFSVLLLVMAIPMSPGPLRAVWILVSSLVALGAVYWIAAVWTNTTRISAGQEEWIFQRGPLPIPKGQFYIRPIRLDPAACKWVWTDRVEKYKLRWKSAGSGGSADGPLGCIFALVEIGVFLSSIRRELVITHTLYARCADGSDRELLDQLSKREADYVGHRLQELLDGEGGAEA